MITALKIAQLIESDLKENISRFAESKRPKLLILMVDQDHAPTERFVEIKRRFAARVNIAIHLCVASPHITEDIIGNIMRTCEYDGAIIQLPLPRHVDTQTALNHIPTSKDVDVLSPEAMKMFRTDSLLILPPVIGAISEILKRNSITISDKNVTIIGRGRLVGSPAEIWFHRQGANVYIVDEYTPDISVFTKKADIIVSGAGRAGLITENMIKDGVIILDAGCSTDQDGKIVGDADPKCKNKCTLFTPTPGGIGRLTVALLFQNLYKLFLLNKYGIRHTSQTATT